MAKGGRKTIYEPSRHPKIAMALARDGYIDIEIAKLIGISRKVFYEWCKRYPKFRDALKKGKLEIDLEVEDSLLKRALGFQYEETEIINHKTMVDGQEITVPGRIKKTKKLIPPDVTACIFWLKNRMKDKWRDVQQKELTGKDGGPIEVTEKLSKEVIKEIAEMTPEQRQARIHELIAKGRTGIMPSDGDRAEAES